MPSFQLLNGTHAAKDKDGNQVIYKSRFKGNLQPGFSDIVHTDKDLVALFGPKKFKRLDADDVRSVAAAPAPVPQEDEQETDLYGFTVEELKAYAEEVGAKITSGMRKDEIVAAIEEAQAE